MTEHYRIKELDPADLQDALRLVWEVFREFEAPEYSPEGIREFQDFIRPSAIAERRSKGELRLWGCYDGDTVTGIIATKPPCHISLLFVDKNYHRQGIARRLYHTVLDNYRGNAGPAAVTVHSSPYALQVYRRLGFVETDMEQTVNGLRFTPMRHTFPNGNQ